MATKIDTVSSRDRLKPRREPYWHRMSKGCYLGFRRMVSTGHGNWIARAMQESSGKENYKALGELSDLSDHLRFNAAQKAAQMEFEHLGRGGTAGSPTDADACSRTDPRAQERAAVVIPAGIAGLTPVRCIPMKAQP